MRATCQPFGASGLKVKMLTLPMTFSPLLLSGLGTLSTFEGKREKKTARIWGRTLHNAPLAISILTNG